MQATHFLNTFIPSFLKVYSASWTRPRELAIEANSPELLLDWEIDVI
jgi:hypothetical protein